MLLMPDDSPYDFNGPAPRSAERLRGQIARHLRYLNRLCERMNRLGFPPDDPLYVAAERARTAIQGLHVAAHYASCEHGVGEPSGA